MSRRGDVRRMLLARGWAEGEYALLRKSGATWAGIGTGDPALSGPDRGRAGRIPSTWTIEFPGGVPARVIVAACEAAAKNGGEPNPGDPRALHPDSATR